MVTHTLVRKRNRGPGDFLLGPLTASSALAPRSRGGAHLSRHEMGSAGSSAARGGLGRGRGEGLGGCDRPCESRSVSPPRLTLCVSLSVILLMPRLGCSSRASFFRACRLAG